MSSVRDTNILINYELTQNQCDLLVFMNINLKDIVCYYLYYRTEGCEVNKIEW